MANNQQNAGVIGEEIRFRACIGYGMPHADNEAGNTQGFYFCADGIDLVGHVAGYVTAAQFDLLASALGLPKLAEALKFIRHANAVVDRVMGNPTEKLS